MIRLVLGAAVAAVVMLVLSLLIYQTPLAGLGAGKVNVDQAAALQESLRTTLVETGTYRVPDPNTAAQTGLYAQGPVATIAYNAQGGATGAVGPMRYLFALVLNFLVALAIGAALIAVERQVSPFGNRWRAGLLFGFAASAFMHLNRPLWLLSDWSSALFGMFADGIILTLAGLIVAWFAPRPRPVTAETVPEPDVSRTPLRTDPDRLD